jgi:ubiquinone/menaquinone biosynthesis C-methylase UbiE
MDVAPLADRYYADAAAAFARARLDARPNVSTEDVLRAAGAAGLDLHHFKRTSLLPRVARVLGVVRGMAPTVLVDVGIGRGAFLWPLLDAFPELRVLAVDRDPRCVADVAAVRAGGLDRVAAARMDAHRLALGDACADGVTLLEVLEHLERPALAAAEALRVARRFVVVSVPSKPDQNRQHIHLFDRAALEAMLRGAGARRVSVDHVLNHIVAVALA